MPLPLDLASVCWLALHREERVGWGGWVTWQRAWGFQTDMETWRRRALDAQKVAEDQRRHIRSLEDQLLPFLTRETGEQEAML